MLPTLTNWIYCLSQIPCPQPQYFFFQQRWESLLITNYTSEKVCLYDMGGQHNLRFPTHHLKKQWKEKLIQTILTPLIERQKGIKQDFSDYFRFYLPPFHPPH